MQHLGNYLVLTQKNTVWAGIQTSTPTTCQILEQPHRGCRLKITSNITFQVIGKRVIYLGLSSLTHQSDQITCEVIEPVEQRQNEVISMPLIHKQYTLSFTHTEQEKVFSSLTQLKLKNTQNALVDSDSKSLTAGQNVCRRLTS